MPVRGPGDGEPVLGFRGVADKLLGPIMITIRRCAHSLGLLRFLSVAACVFAVMPQTVHAQCVPTEEKPPSSAEKRAAAKLDLRHAWEPKAKYQYEVLIEAQLPDRKLTFQGMSVYQVQQADDGRFTLVHTGGLQKNEAMKPQPHPPVRAVCRITCRTCRIILSVRPVFLALPSTP